MARNETDYKRWLKSKWPWFKSNVEYGRGGASGFPDMMFKCPQWKETLFVEAKIGVVKFETLCFTELRRDQFAWHREFAQAKGFSFVFVGVLEKPGWSTYVLPYSFSPLFKEAFTTRKIDINDCLHFRDPIGTAHHSLLLEWQGRLHCPQD